MKSEFRSRLLERVGNILDLSDDGLDQLESYYRLLTHWNKRINLTSLVLDPLSASAVDRLFVEPLLAAKQVSVPLGDWVDLGSGGGSPAIPLKIAHPRLKLTMVESRSRKASFLREVARELELRDAVVIGERFNEIAGNPVYLEFASLVTIRAVRLDPDVVQLCRNLLKPTGELFLFSRNHPLAGLEEEFRLVRTVALVNAAKLIIFQRC